MFKQERSVSTTMSLPCDFALCGSSCAIAMKLKMSLMQISGFGQTFKLSTRISASTSSRQLEVKLCFDVGLIFQIKQNVRSHAGGHHTY